MKGSSRQLQLCPKAKEAAAALLPDVAATSDGFHDVFGDPAGCRLGSELPVGVGWWYLNFLRISL